MTDAPPAKTTYEARLVYDAEKSSKSRPNACFIRFSGNNAVGTHIKKVIACKTFVGTCCEDQKMDDKQPSGVTMDAYQ